MRAYFQLLWRASVFGQGFFCPMGKKRAFHAICAYFRQLLVFSSNLHKKLKKSQKKSQRNPKKSQRNLKTSQKKSKNIIKNPENMKKKCLKNLKFKKILKNIVCALKNPFFFKEKNCRKKILFLSQYQEYANQPELSSPAQS